MAKNNQQLINEIEVKIQETQSLITNYENDLASQKSKLQELITQLQEIKETMKINNEQNNASMGEIDNN